QGTIMGQAFTPERVFWRGEDLMFEEGPEERPRRALTIRFARAGALLQDPVIERLPGDEGAWPELILQWYSGALSAPGLRKVVEDYSIGTRFSGSPDGRVAGCIHMDLANHHSTRQIQRLE